jgi:copper chaperone CopZ
VGSPCCDDNCCAPASACCATGAECCELSPTIAEVAPAPRAKASKACCCGSAKAASPDEPVKADAATSKIVVDGMTCAGCAKSAGKAVTAVEGVESALADVKTKTLTVVAKKGVTPSPKAMWEAVEKAGFTPTRIEGAVGTFQKKPSK